MSDAREKEKRSRELANLAWVMSDARGRAFIRRLLVHCRTYGSVVLPVAGVPEEATPWYGAGLQDVGHFVVNEVALADPSSKLYSLMNSEAHNRLIVERHEAEQRKPKEEAND